MSRETAAGARVLESRLEEAFDALWNDFVDPRGAYLGDGGELWSAIGPGGARGSASVSLPQLGELRDECRRLAIANEYAINGHENRISYIVGSGHRYRATVRKGVDADGSLAARVQETLEDFQSLNGWHDRQQEIVRRIDRDGEVFLRWFASPDGKTRVRFIEPEQVETPAEHRADQNASHGILTDPRDVESVRGYYVDGRLIDADEVQHRRANVDRSVKRGLPLYTPVRANLRRAERLLRNMSVVAEIQSAIALIRKHRSATRGGVEQFVADNATSSRVDTRGRVKRVTEYGPGTILDAPAGLEYDFPATGIDAGS
ncbi:MAG: phage portal protein [Planctomycetota bacterium]